MVQTKNSNPTIHGIPEDWENWPSVKGIDFKVVKVCPHVWNDVYIYSNEIDRYGFLTKENILTAPIFAKHYKVIDKEVGLVAIVSAKVGLGPNNWVILDMKSGRQIVDGISCFFKLDSQHLAYRLDDSTGTWPNNMKWGVVELPSGKEVMPPTAIPFVDWKENYIPVRERIRRAMAKIA